MTLAALLAVTTGAWAQEPTVRTGQVNVSELNKNDILAEGFSLTGTHDGDYIMFEADRYKRNGALQTESDGSTIISIMSYGENGAITDIVGYTYVPVDEDKLDGNAWVVTWVEDYGTNILISLAGIYYDPNGVAMTYNDDRTVWTIDKMPASDVELTVSYYKEAEVSSPATAATDVHIGEDKALLSGLSTEHGTLVYTITKNDVTTPPADILFAANKNTAKDLKTEGTYRVWYYVYPDATHSPSDPAYKDVTVLTNKFDITFTAANANTIESGKATVKVGDNPATPDADGKISGVTMGQTVKISSEEGYKIVGANEAGVYTSEVAMSSLQVGDILFEGATITTPGNDKLVFHEGRMKSNDNINTSDVTISIWTSLTLGENSSIKLSDDDICTPVDGSGQDCNAWEVTNVYNDSYTIIILSGITYTPLATINAAKTEATLTMPASAVELRYDLRRDLSTETAVTVSIGGQEATADTRLRIAKDGNGIYKPVKDLTCSFADTKESVTISDAGEILLAGLKPQFYLKGNNDSWTLVTDINAATHLPTNIAPGQTYQMALAALDASIYTGETPRTVSITIYEGYEVTVPAKSFMTYYKDENLYVENNDVKLYTINSVSDTEVVLSDPLSVAPAETPLLIYNGSAVANTFLLIPTTDKQPDLVTPDTKFKGTLDGIKVSDISAKAVYVLYNNTFMRTTTGTIPANKAYIALPAASGARQLTIVGGETTGIHNAQGTMHNENGAIYDLQGRKLSVVPASGMYIQNGKKIIITNKK